MTVDEVANGQEGAHDATSCGLGRNLRRIGSHHFDGFEDSGTAKANGLTRYGLVPVTAVLVVLGQSRNLHYGINLHLRR